MKLNYFERAVLRKVIADMEERQFRTEHDFGANNFAMQTHNYYRHRAGLPYMIKDDLAKWCATHGKYDLCHKDAS